MKFIGWHDTAVLALVVFLTIKTLAWTKGEHWFWALVPMAFCYPVGILFFREHLIGPRIIRFYLADAGFVQCGAVGLVHLVQLGYSFKDTTVSKQDMIRLAYGGANAGLVIALGHEFLQALDHHGDWIDAVIFVAAYALTIYIIRSAQSRK